MVSRPDSAPRSRAPYTRTNNGMDLPPGKTCGDCVHCRRCMLMFGHIPEDESCDWYPVRFQQKEDGKCK